MFCSSVTQKQTTETEKLNQDSPRSAIRVTIPGRGAAGGAKREQEVVPSECVTSWMVKSVRARLESADGSLAGDDP